EDLISADDALKCTELAMLEAKKRGKNQAVLFDQRMQDELFARVQFEEALRSAIPSQLRGLYQPQIDQQRGLLGAEILVRWRHPEQGLVSPARFIPLAEETGLILSIGQWVLGAACRQLHQWAQDPATASLVLAVNVSVKEFRDAGYVDGVLRILQETQANPHRLKLELTESVLAEDVDAVVHKMQALKAVGISFSLDDFGTGFSSLSYLKRMPLDQLKIDQSFVRDVTTHASDASIVRAVIALGQGLGLNVIAEGVETVEQQRLLQAYGCGSYQGYLFGRPAPVEEFEAAMGNAWPL
ncbi:MAG: EAL domain-containing protein, partial [Acidovorax sp.]|nr:EAL domain-containing protein [Acidovorax sp.]